MGDCILDVPVMSDSICGRQADASNAEIEVTPAMLAAGVDELWVHDLEHEPRQDVVRQVFFAMLRARPELSPEGPSPAQ